MVRISTHEPNHLKLALNKTRDELGWRIPHEAWTYKDCGGEGG